MSALWNTKAAELLAKLIGQLCTEELLKPVADGNGYRLELGEVRYLFEARRGAFGGWRVAAGSIRRTAAGILGDDESEPATDPLRFVADAAEALDLPGATVAGFLAELTSTLAADVRMAGTAVANAELLDEEHLDGHLTGHPLLVTNKGRLGFSAADSERYAPEARTPFRLSWLAVRRGLAEFRGTPDLSSTR